MWCQLYQAQPKQTSQSKPLANQAPGPTDAGKPQPISNATCIHNASTVADTNKIRQTDERPTGYDTDGALCMAED